MSEKFVHLHLHSQYSLLEATCQFKPLAEKAKAFGMPAVALTDSGNMFGAVEFYFACKAADVNPILGMDVYLAPGSRLQKGQENKDSAQPNRRLVLLAQNYKGYQNLCRISTIGYQEGFYYRPRIDYDVLKEINQDIICLSGGFMGEIPWTFRTQGPDKALEKVRELKQIFGDRFYLELNRTGLNEWKETNEFLIEASRIAGVSLVAANDVHYIERGDQLAQEVLICIGSNRTLQDPSRFRLGSDQFYFKSSEQMRQLFNDVPQACDATLEIAERCKVAFKLKNDKGNPIYHLPTYPAARPLNEEIRALSMEGLERRFQEAAHRGEPVSEELKPNYFKRLDYELSVIDQMGFTGYFLIVQDFIGWAKEHDIPVGPGRGSGAGSLVAYSLRITDLDPMTYNLVFERFLNPERISMPDFDIDFCQDRRPEVIQYVTDKYGQASVSQIITFGKLQTKAAIRDVGRVLGMTFSEVDVIAKLIPEKLGITIKEAIETEPRLRELMDTDPKINTLMDMAQKIEGLCRHAGIHAAGVVICDGAIVQHAPLYKGVEGENVVQFDMKHAEKIGLIKFDFLGLKTLTLIHNALKLIEKNRGKKLTTSDISLSDPGIYEVMCKGDTAGIFQFEGEGITDLIRKAKPNCFEDITALNALYRPGPMDMIPDYLARKHGKIHVEYLFPELEDILKETYGIIVYQEQVQLIAARIASYTLGEADMLRRAMGKKIAAEMAQQRERFLKGAEKNGFDVKKSEELFDLMAEFANYGFNKSHAAAYCVVAAQTAYLKNYYPVEFFAAMLSTEMSDTDKVVWYVKDAQAHGIEVVPPDVSLSEYYFTVEGEKIIYSLGAIKGVGQSAVEAIVEARQSKPSKKFESLEDFFTSIDLRRVNKKVIECLIKAGAFDAFGAHRAQLMSQYSKFMDRAGQSKKDAEVGQVSLFDMEETKDLQVIQLDPCEPWSRAARLAFEKEVLGFYLSDHPLKGFEKVFALWSTNTVEKLKEVEPKKIVIVTGLISQLREVITKKGTRMAFGRLEDLTGGVELVIFPDAFAATERVLKEEKPIVVTAKLEREEDSSKLLVESVERVENMLLKFKRLVIKMDQKLEPRVPELRALLEKFPGPANLSIEIELPELEKTVQMEVSEPAGVKLESGVWETVFSQFGRTDFLELRG